jgi:hypothetical protein
MVCNISIFSKWAKRVVVLTIFTLANGAWATYPQEDLQQLTQRKIRARQELELAKHHIQEASTIRESHLRGTPAPDTEEFVEQRKKGYDRTLRAENSLKKHDQLTEAFQDEMKKTRELSDKLSGQKNVLFVQNGNKTPDFRTDSGKEYFALQQTIDHVRREIAESEASLQKSYQEKSQMEKNLEENKKHFGAPDRPPK